MISNKHRSGRHRYLNRFVFNCLISFLSTTVILFSGTVQAEEKRQHGARHIPMIVPVIETAGWYMKELMKYPPHFKIGFLSNNPPMYNLAPKAREMMQKTMEKRGLGRANP